MALALKSKNDLKNVFSGVSNILIKKDGFTGALTNLVFDYDMPVILDTLSMTMSDPTINKVMVHGMIVPWCSTSTPGEFSFSATVPSIHEELSEWFLGGKVNTAPVSATLDSKTFTGNAYSMKNTKLIASVGLLSEDGKKLLLIKKISIYASPSFDNASTTPYCFKLTGTIEATEDATQDDILILEL